MSVDSNVIGLQFAKTLCVDGLTLIALPKEVEKAIENGEHVCFKSSSDDGMTRAVLCTEQSTYAMMRVESSNVSFLADISQTDSAASKQRREGDREAPNVVAIQDQFQSSLELFVEVPDFTSLRRSLQQHVFSVGDDKDADADAAHTGGLTLTQILERTCASNAEIPMYLDSHAAFMRLPVEGSLYTSLKGDDRFVFVEDETLDTHFDLLLVAVMSQGIPLTKGDVSVDAVVKACDVQGTAAHAVIQHLIHALRPRGEKLDGERFQLDPAAVARYRIGFVNLVAREVSAPSRCFEPSAYCPLICFSVAEKVHSEARRCERMAHGRLDPRVRHGLSVRM